MKTNLTNFLVDQNPPDEQALIGNELVREGPGEGESLWRTLQGIRSAAAEFANGLRDSPNPKFAAIQKVQEKMIEAGLMEPDANQGAAGANQGAGPGLC